MEARVSASMGFEPALEAVFFVAMMSSLVFLLGLDLKRPAYRASAIQRKHHPAGAWRGARAGRLKRCRFGSVRGTQAQSIGQGVELFQGVELDLELATALFPTQGDVDPHAQDLPESTFQVNHVGLLCTYRTCPTDRLLLRGWALKVTHPSLELSHRPSCIERGGRGRPSQDII